MKKSEHGFKPQEEISLLILVLKAERVVLNMFTGEIKTLDVAVHEGFVVGLGKEYSGDKEIDVQGKWIVPGLIGRTYPS